MQKQTRKMVIVGAILFVIIWPLLSLGKYAAYELQPKMGLLRESVGQRVVVYNGLIDNPVEGILIFARYRFSGKAGFFELEIEISGESRWTRRGISPWELHKKVVLPSKD